MECVNPRLAVVQVRRRDPFGVAVLIFAGGPALFGQGVVAAAAERDVVDVGGVGFRPGCHVMDFGEVSRHIAARRRAATILGVQHYSLGR